LFGEGEENNANKRAHGASNSFVSLKSPYYSATGGLLFGVKFICTHNTLSPSYELAREGSVRESGTGIKQSLTAAGLLFAGDLSSIAQLGGKRETGRFEVKRERGLWGGALHLTAGRWCPISLGRGKRERKSELGILSRYKRIHADVLSLPGVKAEEGSAARGESPLLTAGGRV